MTKLKTHFRKIHNERAVKELSGIKLPARESSAASLSNQVFEMNFSRQFPRLKCPAFFFAGRKDLTTNSKLTETYFKALIAPKKQLFWFEKSAHGIADTKPELMQEVIINHVLVANQH